MEIHLPCHRTHKWILCSYYIRFELLWIYTIWYAIAESGAKKCLFILKKWYKSTRHKHSLLFLSLPLSLSVATFPPTSLPQTQSTNPPFHMNSFQFPPFRIANAPMANLLHLCSRPNVVCMVFSGLAHSHSNAFSKHSAICEVAGV